jgi:hypothetical protein
MVRPMASKVHLYLLTNTFLSSSTDGTVGLGTTHLHILSAT